MGVIPGYTWAEFFYSVVFIYLVLTLLFTIYSVIRMFAIEHRSNDKKSGQKRIMELRKSGKFTQMPVYSMEEMLEEKDKEDVRLFCFPADSPKTNKFVMILPGGGYAHCCTKEEGYPIAAALNRVGITAFILEYRTRLNCSPFAPMEDLGAALKLIEANQDKFGVTIDDYALMGFSAGGNLAGIFASGKHGYKEFDLPKPGAVILGYPWTCVNDWLHHPYWNIWIGLLGIWLSNRGSVYMFGLRHLREGRKSLDVQNYVDEDYPKTYMFTGGWDILVPASRHADVVETALKKNNIKYQYQKYFGLPHGIGLGLNTKAEGWLNEAVDFWMN